MGAHHHDSLGPCRNDRDQRPEAQPELFRGSPTRSPAASGYDKLPLDEESLNASHKEIKCDQRRIFS